MLVLSRKIRSAVKRYDFESAFLVGPQGMGKTTYGMLVLYEIYRDWDLVLHYTVFDPRPVLYELKECLTTGRRIPTILFDDAGIHLSKYLPQIEGNAELVMVLNATYNLIRTGHIHEPRHGHPQGIKEEVMVDRHSYSPPRQRTS